MRVPQLLKRREALVALGAAVSGGMLASALSAAQSKRLFAFLPTYERPRSIEETLVKALPGVTPTVFGRFADFAAALAAEKPEGALAPLETLKAVGVPAALQGTTAGSPLEPYVVVTKILGGSVQDLAARTFGVVDIVGRSALPELTQRLLQLPSPPTVRRVLQLGDLLPLLHLDLAPSVILPERFYAELHNMSHLTLRVLRPSSATLGRTAFGFPSGQVDAALALSLEHATAATRGLLGVEVWS
jgi:hypothetical protein